MSTTDVRSNDTSGIASVKNVDMKLEVVVIPVSDVDRAAEFYGRLGWRLDADIREGDGRALQFTPPGSSCSIIFGTGVTPSAPGTAQFLFLVVSDIEAAREELIGKGVDASEVFHDAGGGYNFFNPDVRASGPDPERRSYASFLTFRDPDGNG
jgi:catechol 2,3-dioxygenase-like lactoylglutathione lyase family enzyme